MGAKLYDLRAVSLSIGGIPIGEYGPNDALGVEWADDLVYEEVSADGQAVYSRVNDPRMRVIVNLLATSPSVADLMDLAIRQHGLDTGVPPSAITPLAFLMRDHVLGDLISSEHTVFLDRPSPIKAKTVTTVAFRLSLPNPEYTFGALNRSALVAP